MRHYWEAIFSTEYFPYWEFSMCIITLLLYRCIQLLHKIIDKQQDREPTKWF